MKKEDIIERLKVLDEKECYFDFEIEPNVERFENLNGEGLETISYTYTITITTKPKSRKYKNNYGIIKYIKEKENNNE